MQHEFRTHFFQLVPAAHLYNMEDAKGKGKGKDTGYNMEAAKGKGKGKGTVKGEVIPFLHFGFNWGLLTAVAGKGKGKGKGEVINIEDEGKGKGKGEWIYIEDEGIEFNINTEDRRPFRKISKSNHMSGKLRNSMETSDSVLVTCSL